MTKEQIQEIINALATDSQNQAAIELMKEFAVKLQELEAKEGNK